MQRRIPDVNKLHQATGYRPTTSVNEIIADVVEHRRALLSAAV
jgi:nucleoside-diphosphate-sugar epimerase